MLKVKSSFCKKALIGSLAAFLVVTGCKYPSLTVNAANYETSAGLTTDYTINNWGSGYQVLIKVKNDGKQNVNTWTLKVNKSDVKIDNSWCVNVKESGNYYVITPMEWNSVIEPGRSVDFGIQGNGSIGTSVGITVE